jgi:hypothetical protein
MIHGGHILEDGDKNILLQLSACSSNSIINQMYLRPKNRPYYMNLSYDVPPPRVRA